MFGVGSYIGRVFTEDDDRAGADPVVVMSYRTWNQKYGMDPSVVGKSFTFNGLAMLYILGPKLRRFSERRDAIMIPEYFESRFRDS